MPLTFADPADYDRIDQGDSLILKGIFAGMESGEITMVNETKGIEIKLSCSFTERQIAILKAGDLLQYTKLT